MGQEDVKKVLKESKAWLLSTEISKIAGYSLGSVQASLRKMAKWGEVKRIEAKRIFKDKTGYAYKLIRRK